MENILTHLTRSALSRRNFIAGAGTAAAGSILAGCGSGGPIQLPAVTSYTDTDILNFALNLEYVEAEFYLRAATGTGLSAADAGASAGTVTGGTKIPGLTPLEINFVNEIAYTEQEHVRFLRSALGSAAVSRPNIDLTAGFNGIVGAANGFAGSSGFPAIPTSFSPFNDFNSFLVAALTFEDVGVTAYDGAAPLISPAGIASGYLAAAAGIMAIEAYHAGYIRTTLTANSILQGDAAYPYAQYANLVATLVNSLSGATKDLPLTGFAATPVSISTVGMTNIVPADTNAIAFPRTTDEVLHIVYESYSPTPGSTTLSAGVSGGGFFPNGINGNISVTQS